MRILFLIVILVSIISLDVVAQTRPDLIEISYNANDKPVREVIREIAAISGISIAYSEHRLPVEYKVTLAFVNEKLGDVLNSMLQKVGLEYQLVGNQIVLTASNNQLSDRIFTIYGYVRDVQTGESLIGANVYLPDKSSGTASNYSGFYSLKVKGGQQRIHYSYLGYKPAIADLNLFKDTVINVRLKQDGRLHEIVITENLFEQSYERVGEIQNLQPEMIGLSFHPGGSSDIFRYLHTLPGVSSGADGIGGLSVRGGAPDQNLMLIDGVPVYNPTHALGVVSAFNSSIIKNASFIKGGVPARYSGRISSVLDIHTRDGNQNNLSGEFSMSPMVLSGNLEGPLFNKKSSFLLSYRTTIMNLWLNRINGLIETDPGTNSNIGYGFSDFNAKFNYTINDRNKIQLHAYQGSDNFDRLIDRNSINISDKENDDLGWGNRMVSAKWSSELSGVVFSRLTMYHTSYSFQRYYNDSWLRSGTDQQNGLVRAGIFSTDISENALTWDVDWMAHSNHLIKTGLAYKHRNLLPLSYHISGDPVTDPEILKNSSEEYIRGTFQGAKNYSGELSLYIEDEISFSKLIKLNAGLHTTYLTNYDNYSTIALQPRISALAGNDYFHVKAGASKMFQPMHMISNSAVGLMSEIWLGVDQSLPAADSWLFNAGLGVRNKNGYRFGIDLFYRLFDNLIIEREGSEIQLHSGVQWKGDLVNGNGKAYGFESTFEKMAGQTLFNVNYAFTVSNRQFTLLNNGNDFPYQLNRLHNLKLAFTHRFSGLAECMINWNIGSGNHYTQPSNATFITDSNFTLLYTSKNNASFPVFHRLDAGIVFHKSHSWGNSKLYIGVNNMFNRQNPFYINIRRSVENPEKLEIKQLSFLPFMPSLSYSVNW